MIRGLLALLRLVLDGWNSTVRAVRLARRKLIHALWQLAHAAAHGYALLRDKLEDAWFAFTEIFQQRSHDRQYYRLKEYAKRLIRKGHSLRSIAAHLGQEQERAQDISLLARREVEAEDQLVRYVARYLRAGASQREIFAELLPLNWSRRTVRRAYREARKRIGRE